MIQGYIDTYKQLELKCKYEIDQQIELYAIGSPNYDKNKLREKIVTYRAAKNLKGLISAYNLKQQQIQAIQKTPVK